MSYMYIPVFFWVSSSSDTCFTVLSVLAALAVYVYRSYLADFTSTRVYCIMFIREYFYPISFIAYFINSNQLPPMIALALFYVYIMLSAVGLLHNAVVGMCLFNAFKGCDVTLR